MSKLTRRHFAAAGLAATAARSLRGRETSYAEQMPDMLLTHLAYLMNGFAERWDQSVRRSRPRPTSKLATGSCAKNSGG